MPEASGSELRRGLGPLAVFATATGTMIGAGIFVLPGPAAALAGPSSSLAFVVAGAIALVAALSSAELATAMPHSGGSYHFTSRAMGPLVGCVVGLGAWIGLLLKGSFALVGLAWYVSYFSPVPVLAVVVVAGVFLVLVNWVGAEESGGLQNLVVLGLVGLLAIFVAEGAVSIETERFSSFFSGGSLGLLSATGLVFISYLGIVKATAVAGEVEDPGTTFPRALVASVVFVTFLYAAIMLIVTGVLSPEAVADSSAPVATAAESFMGSAGGYVVALAGVFATVSTANAATLSSSRFPFAMSRDGLVTPWFRRTSRRFGTPSNSIVFTGVVMVGLAVSFDVELLAKLGGTFGILVFALINLAVVVLRASKPDWYQPAFSMPLSPALPLAGTAAALALVPFMGLVSQLTAVVFVVAGVAWYLRQTRVGEDVEPDHDIGDQISRVRYRRAIEEKQTEMDDDASSKVVVEVVEGESNRDLLTIVSAFAERFDATLEVVVISELPPQVPLDGTAFDAGVDVDWRRKLEDRLGRSEVDVDFHHVLARDRTEALLDRIDDDVELVVVDWHEPVRRHNLRESHVDEILRSDVPVRVAVLKHRGISDLRDIVVAAGESPYDRAEVELADAIASYTGGRLRLLKVLPMEASEQAVDTAREYLDGLSMMVESDVDTEVVESDDVRISLVEQGDTADLLVLGAPSHPDRLHEFFGQTTDLVAHATSSSVLVGKDPEGEAGWLSRFLGRL
ncbi:MAG: amino acid permease [Halobacteriales archaeon]